MKYFFAAVRTPPESLLDVVRPLKIHFHSYTSVEMMKLVRLCCFSFRIQDDLQLTKGLEEALLVFLADPVARIYDLYE